MRQNALPASLGCTAALVGGLWLAACARPEIEVLTAPTAAGEEASCAWFGDVRDGTLYFGQAAFWSALQAEGGDPRADLARSGPVLLGRFDLERRRLLAPLRIAAAEPSGTWDVLALANGRVYFTTFFSRAGFVDPESGEVRRFGPDSVGWNELSPGPEGSLLATRYGGGPGAVVRFDVEGRVQAELPLAEPPGRKVAAKSVAFDPARREIWVNTDLLAEPADGRPPAHDARVLDPEGGELLRFEDPELQFMRFAPDGTGWLALREGRHLVLRTLAADRAGPLAGGRDAVLDEDFEGSLDFVQELTVAAGGSVLATRWSGRVHRVHPDGRLESYRLPRPRGQGLYYTGVLAGSHLCATHCGEVTVVCRSVD